MTKMTLTEARVGIAGAARRAAKNDEPTVLTDRGEEVAAVISIDEYRELVELRKQTTIAELRRRQQSIEWVDQADIADQLA